MCGIATFGFGYPPLLKFYRLSRPNKGPRRFEESNLKLSILKINSLNVVLHFYPIFPNFTTQKRNHDQRFRNVQFCLCFCLVNLIFKYFQTDIEQWLFKITRVLVRYHKKRLTHKIRDLDPFESICLLLDNIKHFNKGVALCSYYYHEIVLYTGTCIRLTRNNGYFY